MRKLRAYAAAAILGAAVGALTLIGQRVLPINFNFLANSGAIWLVPSFFVSSLSKSNKSHSIALCVLCLLCCVNGYYVSEAIMNHHAFSVGKWQLVWTAMAFIAGGVFGIGAYFANSGNSLLKCCGLNLLPAVFFSEGVNKLIHLGDYLHMIPAVMLVTCIGLILYFAVNRADCFKMRNLLSFAALSLLGLAGYEMLYRLSV